MAQNFIGEVRLMAFNFPPKGWALCNGQLLSIQSNQALFSLLGTIYGGNGSTNFALPNFQGRVMVGMTGSSAGTVGGEASVTLNVTQMPAHTHTLMGNNTAALTLPNGGSQPANHSLAEGFVGTDATNQISLYGTGTPDRVMNTGTLSTVGGQPHENRQPYLVLNYVIATQGIFPSRN